MGRARRNVATCSFLTGVFVTLFIFAGCCDECNETVLVDLPPAAPTGVYSITGDEFVEIVWNPNTEPDLAGYEIYWSDSEVGDLDLLASVPRHRTYYLDSGLRNGTTYFYAIVAYDYAGQASELSEEIFDTPRPAGTGLILHDYLGQNSGSSGYDFSNFTVQAWNFSTTDVYFGSPNGVPTLSGKGPSIGTGVDVQDYGFIDLDFVDWAPDISDGWSPSKRVEMIPGHSYVVQILGASEFYFYAKVYCETVSNDFVVLNWAYQQDPGNPELSPGQGGAR